MQLLQNQGGQRGDRPQHTTLQQFLAISPPRFAEARDPLEADDWLSEIKKHFTANSVRPLYYVTFASFQLQGAAGSWFSTYKANKGDAEITWEDFVRDFRAAHIPSGLIERKREEFLALRQGTVPCRSITWASSGSPGTHQRRSRQRPSALPGSAVVLPRTSSMRSPCPRHACSQSSSTRLSDRSQLRKSVPQRRGSRESTVQQ